MNKGRRRFKPRAARSGWAIIAGVLHDKRCTKQTGAYARAPRTRACPSSAPCCYCFARRLPSRLPSVPVRLTWLRPVKPTTVVLHRKIIADMWSVRWKCTWPCWPAKVSMRVQIKLSNRAMSAPGIPNPPNPPVARECWQTSRVSGLPAQSMIRSGRRTTWSVCETRGNLQIAQTNC